MLKNVKTDKISITSIKTKLIVATCFVLIITVGILSFFNLRGSETALSEKIAEAMLGNAETAAEGVAKEVAAIKAVAEFVAADDKIKTADPNVFVPRLAEIKKAQPKIDTLFFINPDGKYVTSEGKYPGALNDREYFKEVVQKQATVIGGDPVVSKSTGNLVVVVVVPVKENGQIKGFIGASVSINAIKDYILDRKIGKDGYAYIVGKSGLIFIHPNDQVALKLNTLTSENISPALREMTKESLSGKKGAMEYEYGGITKFAGYAPVPGTPWAVSTTMSKEEAMAEIGEMIKQSMLIAVVALLLAAVFIYFIAARMVNPIIRLAEAADRIASGDLTQTVTVSSNDEIGQLAAAFNSMGFNLRNLIQHVQKNAEQAVATSEQLLDLDRLKDEFLARVSHELKTPLHGIIGLAESMKKTVVYRGDKWIESNLDLIASSGNRLDKLVDEIMDFTILKNNQVDLKQMPISINDIVKMVLTLEISALKNKRVSLENQVPEDTPLVYADGERLIQILHNLVRNAIKFTHEGKVVVSACTEGDTVYISVCDTGIGIVQARLEDIFNPFEQGNLSIGRHYGGVGLGLSIARNLIELHGGSITVTSTPGEGSKFTFTLPVWKGENNCRYEVSRDSIAVIKQTQEPVYYEENNAHQFPEQQAETKRVLVVDDEEVNLVVVKNYFEGTVYRLVCVKSGEAALAEIGRNQYDLVLLDMMMPGLNGLEVCREIRKTNSELPIIMLTVRNRPEDIAAAFKAGANDYITKPFQRKELVTRAEAQLRLQEAYKNEQRIHWAEVTALQAQIQPHFLYNTLNAIMAFCRTNPKKAEEMIEELSNYLQGKFRFNTIDLIPLEKELELIKSYLTIEKVRFGERLNVIFNIEAGANPFIPPLILQPLVENAVRHGIYPKRGGGTLHISVEKKVKETHIRIIDDGVGMTLEQATCLLSGKAQDVGIGIQNIDRRLKKHYGYGLEIQSEVGRGTTIIVRVSAGKG